MTLDQIRPLLERVHEHGGPVQVFGNGFEINDGDRYLGVFDEQMTDHVVPLDVQDHLVPVLKRDLISRGYDQLETRWAHGYWMATALRTDTIKGPVEKWKTFDADGDSEVEAMLKLWVEVAEAEGWTP